MGYERAARKPRYPDGLDGRGAPSASVRNRNGSPHRSAAGDPARLAPSDDVE